MKKFRFKKMDAFTDGKSGGNPAAAVYLDSFDQIAEDEMRKIALEMKGFVNEVGYVSREDERTFRLRYFSSEREVDFCGHATIAIVYDIVTEDRGLFNEPFLTVITNHDRLAVENRAPTEDAVFISAPPPRFTSHGILSNDIERALKVDEGVLHRDWPVDIINAGLQTLIVPISGLEGILSILPDEGELKAFCERSGIDIIVVFSPEVISSQNAYRTRVFAPTFGYLEDPATGSGNAALGYYLLKHEHWSGDIILLEQNGSRHNYNTVKILARPDREQNLRVIFGGRAVTRITGEYLLHQ